MGRKGYLHDLLVQKEEQILLLESRIQAYAGRISLLQSRLLATLDTLDVIQTNQAHELSSAASTQASFREQLDEYKKVVEAAELERDDLRDAVSELIKKVEESNDCKNWPHSRISLSSLPDPLSLAHRHQARSHDEEELLSYATAMVDALRRERDAERSAHAKTQEQAETRILALEAKLSRREAELEAYIVGDRDRSEVNTEAEQATPRVKPKVLFGGESDVIANDQITAMFDETVARNKRLESEITILYRRLEKARAKKSENRSDAVPYFASPTSNAVPTVGQMRPSQNAAYLNYSSSSSAPNTVSPLTHRVQEEDPHTPTGSLRVYDESFHDVDGNNEVLRSLQRQVMLLGEKIDTFAHERNVLSETLSHRQYESLHQPSDESSVEMEDHDVSQEAHPHFSRFQELGPAVEKCLQCLETGCASLQASVNALRDELAVTREAAQARESTLIYAINELRLTVFTRAAPPLSEPVEHETEPEQMHQTENVPPLAVSHQDQPPTNTGALDHYANRTADDHDVLRPPVRGEAESEDGEVSMELATPLVAPVELPPSPSASVSGSHGGASEDEQVMDHALPSPSGDRWAPVPADRLLGAESRNGNGDGDVYAGHAGENAGHDTWDDPEGGEAEDEGEGYVDPPSVQLPPSPVESAPLEARAYGGDVDPNDYSQYMEEEDIVDADSPTLSHIAPLPGMLDPQLHTNNHSRSLYHATSSFVAELRHVEQEIAQSQVRLEEGMTALERVGELVEELDLP